MKPLHTLLYLVFLLPLSVIAQSNYKPGYVVNLKGDTLRGFVDYQEWDANPDAVNFKKSLTDQATKYGAGDATAFGIDKLEAFIRYTGRISTDPIDPNKAVTDADRDTSFKVATFFLKVLEKGDRYALYSYKDDLKIRFFLGEAPAYGPKELVFRVTRTNTEYTYRKQLAGAALKYNELTDNLKAFIARSEYTDDNIMDIVSKINHMSKAEYQKSHYSGPIFNLFIGAGVDINTTSPSSVGPYHTAGGRSYTSFGPLEAFGINLFANPATRKLQFRLELSAAQNKYRYFYTSLVVPYVPTEVSYNETILSVEPQVIYNFYNTDNFKIFVGVGIVFSNFSYSNTYFGSQNHDGSEANIAANDPFEFNGGDNAFLLKAGIQFTRHLLIFGNVQTPSGGTNGGYFQLTAKSEQVGINYLF